MALPRLIAKSTLGGAEIAQVSRDVRKWTPKRDKMASPADRGDACCGKQDWSPGRNAVRLAPADVDPFTAA
jgi:hypothetical protein